jgi:hypothetical protein
LCCGSRADKGGSLTALEASPFSTSAETGSSSAIKSLCILSTQYHIEWNKIRNSTSKDFQVPSHPWLGSCKPGNAKVGLNMELCSPRLEVKIQSRLLYFRSDLAYANSAMQVDGNWRYTPTYAGKRGRKAQQFVGDWLRRNFCQGVRQQCAEASWGGIAGKLVHIEEQSDFRNVLYIQSSFRASSIP